MMLLHEFLAQYVLISNTYDLFEYRVFALRMETRFGKRTLRKDYTPEEIQDVAQNTLDVNLLFFRGIAKQVLNPFKTWGETGDNMLGTGFTDTTTPDLTEVVTPNLTYTTTPNLIDETAHTGTVTDEQSSDGTQRNYVNAYNAATPSSPRDNGETHAEGGGTTTYDEKHKTTHTGSTSVARTGETTKIQSGTNVVKHVNEGVDSYTKAGWKIEEYNKVMTIYLSFIDLVIDYIVKDILYITVRG